MQTALVTIGWVFFAFGALRLGVALFNRIDRPYLEGSTRLPEVRVSVLIPARNEQDNLPRLLEGFENWRDEVWELIVYDDASTDLTYEIARDYATVDSKINVLRGESLPSGWLGKPHACDVLSKRAGGDILLFIDADVTLCQGAVAGAARYVRKYGLDLLSVFPTQVMDNSGSRLSVPLMNWILLGLLPLRFVRTSARPSLAAANGQFMVFDRSTYRSITPHSRFRDEPVEDIAIVKYYKTQGLKCATLLGNQSVFCRMYPGLKEAVSGFSKNMVRFFGGHPIVCWLFVVSTTIAPLWIFFFNGMMAGTLYAVMITLLRIVVSTASRQNVLLNVLFLVPQQFVLWWITLKATLKISRKKIAWKGRPLY